MRKPGEPGESFTVGVDDVTGRAVIIRNNREILGGLTREQSITFAQDIIEWQPQFMRASPKVCTCTPGIEHNVEYHAANCAFSKPEAVNGTPS